MPSERSKAIEMLTNAAAQGDIRYGGDHLRDMLMYGHKGFASYSDLELVRAIQTMAKRTSNFEIQNFISTIAADKFILE